MKSILLNVVLISAFGFGYVYFIGVYTFSIERLEIAVVAPLTGSNSHKGSEHMRAVALAASTFDRGAGEYGEGNDDVKAYEGVIRDLKNGRLRFSVTAFDDANNGSMAFKSYLDHYNHPASMLGKTRVIHLGAIAFQTSTALTSAEGLLRGNDPPIPLVSISGATLTLSDWRIDLYDGEAQPRHLRYCPTNEQLAQTMVENMPCSANVFIVYSDDVYSRDLAELVEKSIAESCKEDEVWITKERFGLDLRNCPLGSTDSLGQDCRSAYTPTSIYFCGSYTDAIQYLRVLLNPERLEPSERKRLDFVGSDALYTRDFVLQSEAEAASRAFNSFRIASILPRQSDGDHPGVKKYLESYKAHYKIEPDGVGYHSWRAAEELIREFAMLRDEDEIAPKLARRLRSKYSRLAGPEDMVIEVFPHDQLPEIEDICELRARFGSPCLEDGS